MKSTPDVNFINMLTQSNTGYKIGRTSVSVQRTMYNMKRQFVGFAFIFK